jgi:hypothetical protein
MAIPSGSVQVTERGFAVTLPPGAHFAAPDGLRKLFGYDEVRRSGDQDYHACIVPFSEEFRCLYVPPLGY